MTTGPVEVSPAVLDAQRAAIASPHIGDFWAMHDETIARLGRVMGTQGTVLAFPGTIRAGLSVAIDNFVRPGTRVLAISNGYWGELIADLCCECGADVVNLRLPPLSPVDPEAVRAALAADPAFHMVTIVHVETNVGVTNPIDVIGDMLRDTDTLFFVDTACSAGGMPVDTDRNGIDIGVTGSHKTLAGLPGLSVMTVSEKAWADLGRLSPKPGHFNLNTLVRQTLERPEPPSFTQPPGLFAALHAALGEIEAAGLDAWFERHRSAAASFRARIRAAGLTMVLDHADDSGHPQADAAYSDTVMAVAYAPGMDDEAFRARLRNRHGVFVIGNLGDWKGRSLRVGLMSPPQLDTPNLERTLEAIAETASALRPSRAEHDYTEAAR
jgi:aspartate aminotransferase-like enzyme